MEDHKCKGLMIQTSFLKFDQRLVHKRVPIKLNVYFIRLLGANLTSATFSIFLTKKSVVNNGCLHETVEWIYYGYVLIRYCQLQMDSRCGLPSQ